MGNNKSHEEKDEVPQVLDGKIHPHPGPQLTDSNWLSRLTFWPATRLTCSCGKRKSLSKRGAGATAGSVDHNELWRMKTSEAHSVWKSFKPYWQEELKEKDPSLFRALRRAFWPTFALSYFLQMIYVLFSLTVPVTIPYMLEWILNPDVPGWHGYAYTSGVFLGGILAALAYYHASFLAWSIAAKVRSTLIIMTYKKALKLQGISKDAGKIVNIVAVDAQILSDTFGVYVTGLAGPIQIIVGTGLLWQRIGAFALLPIGTFFVSLPIVGFLNAIYARRLQTTKTAADSRLKLVRELLSAIRIIKYYAWEVPFEQNIQRYRTNEVDRQKATTTVRIGGISTFAAVSPISTGLIFCLFAINNAFQVTTVFTTLALVNMMRTPFQFLPLVIVFSSQYKVALTRVREFCLRPEPQPNAKPTASLKSKSTSIYMKRASFAWDTTEAEGTQSTEAAPVLSDVNLRIKRGSVAMVVGAVGSGKSTLVSGVLGEVPHVSGTIEVASDIAYVPQEAWIINASVKANILFGKPYDEKLYNEVLHASALATDLKIMPAGDATEIGDRGINLSGGQKQRVSIARALYADRDLYVFDDPFSAVDSHVAKHLVEVAVGKFLRSRGKTAFIITNQLQFLNIADHVVFLKGGRVAEQGTFAELLANGADFKQLVKDFGVASEKSSSTSSDSDSAETESPKGEKPSSTTKKSAKKSNKSSKLDLTSPDVTRKELSSAKSSKNSSETAPPASSNAEEIMKGSITFSTYWHYISSGGAFMFFFSVFLMFVIAGFRVFNSIWLSWWADPNPAVSGRWVRDTYIAVYMSLSILEALMVFLRQLPLISWARNASLQLHSSLLSKLTRATSSFYDVTPMGRLLSRFSKDMNLVDDNIQFQFDSYIQQLALLAGLFAQMAATQPYLVIVIVASGILFFLLQRAFQTTAVNIQRLEAISRAPIFSHLAESIEGASSIRAYKMEKAFTRAAINKINDNIVDYLAFRYSFSWFALRLDWLGAMVILATFLSVVVTKNNGTITASLAALALSSTSSITLVLSSTANWAVQLEATMNSVERIRQYMDVEQESAAHIEDTKPEAAWPEKGAVRFKKLSISYNKDGSAPVLKKISAVVKPKEKIGIVGRTGAGKSTLITALFRMVEPSEGTIEIDGVDIRSLGLTDLRSKLSIIPQLPTLFMGSVRYNIDPFNESTDDAIWRALEMVQLKEYVSSLEGKLDAHVEEGGSNFSVGQRQLLSMARALLRNSRVLLLDEATAAVDNETDAMIQSMVRKNFKSQTVFTIAHRLNTIMDSTRVMVLDQGKLVEFDTPAKLLENPNSIFTSMVNATGPASAEYLRKIARGELSVVESLSTPELKRKKPSPK